ncbi:hypothetical protein Tco_1508640 [Tanacetum coccineum]
MEDFNSRTTSDPRTKNMMTGKWTRMHGDAKDYRRKCDVVEKAYEAQREKELGMLQCRELEFLMIDLSSLPPAKRAIVERKQAEIMRKYPDA